MRSNQLVLAAEFLAESRVHRNGSVAELVERSLCEKEASLASTGALVAHTGSRTGRSPRDKFVVRRASNESRIWWGKVNQPIAPDAFEKLRTRMTEHFHGRDAFVFDGYAGADPKHRLPIRVVTELAWHSLFARQLFRRPKREELSRLQPQFTVVCAPNCHANPATDGTNSEAFVVIDLESRTALIGGTFYAGEIKKTIFTVMNYLMPEQSVFPMHCSANVGDSEDVALFFGLSGTGKTSLSADPERQLIGDDEHGWGENGVFNFEGGCYAKCIRLSRDREPQIWDALRFGAVAENVVVNPDTRIINFTDDSITENTRAAYPLDFIANSVHTGMAGHPSAIIFLAADAFGVLPAVARLNERQAMYHFLSGYTAKLAGTEAGMGKEPEATFSTCFGAPFLPLPPRVYADMLAEKMRQHHCRCYLINTGWVGEPYGKTSRILLHYNRVAIREILSGRLDQTPMTIDPVFGFEVPQHCGDTPTELLQLRSPKTISSGYDDRARDLARRFVANFAEHESAAPHIADGGPRL